MKTELNLPHFTGSIPKYPLFYPIYLDDYDFKNLFLVIIEKSENDEEEHIRLIEETITTAYVFNDMLVLKFLPLIYKDTEDSEFTNTVDLIKDILKNKHNIIFNKFDRSGNIIKTINCNDCIIYDITDDVYDYASSNTRPVLEVSVILKFK